MGLEDRFTMGKYDLLKNNCNHFSDEACIFLTGNPLPTYITGLPDDFLSTPLGRMVAPIIQSLQQRAQQQMISQQAQVAPVRSQIQLPPTPPRQRGHPHDGIEIKGGVISEVYMPEIGVSGGQVVGDADLERLYLWVTSEGWSADSTLSSQDLTNIFGVDVGSIAPESLQVVADTLADAFTNKAFIAVIQQSNSAKPQIFIEALFQALSQSLDDNELKTSFLKLASVLMRMELEGLVRIQALTTITNVSLEVLEQSNDHQLSAVAAGAIRNLCSLSLVKDNQDLLLQVISALIHHLNKGTELNEQVSLQLLRGLGDLLYKNDSAVELAQMFDPQVASFSTSDNKEIACAAQYVVALLA
eukprot:TRINITY_DN1576_c0_g1_i2.p1 TRINITY_DN1576_c0_g1~~TRINITY_DN1576_c0_g1_i2.p1  ORF type:complete len:358 (+),score=62.05 TRINITY_DN1576_c0_g1_i2:312-1385(+)